MPQIKKPRPPCQHCGQPVRLPQQRYCSQFCMGQAWRKRVTIACAYCAEQRERRPSEVTEGNNFCREEHRIAFLRERGERERPTFRCAWCHTVRPLPRWAKSQTYCGISCQSAARRTSIARECPVCSTTFMAEPNELANGRGTYCSSPCRYRGRRLRCAAEKPCARVGCVGVIEGSKSSVAKRRYCSSSCRYPSGQEAFRVITCPCGRQRRVWRHQLRDGFGKFCSRQCYADARRAARPEVRCQYRACRKLFRVSPSGVGRRFHSWQCFVRSRAPRSYKCPTCGELFRAKAWRKPRFCSLSCANRGRARGRDPVIVARNARILELDGQGWKAPRIWHQIAEENLAWLTSPEAIRQVIHRAR